MAVSDPAPERVASRSILLAVFATAFLDLVGFSIIFPLYPAMLETYLAAEGPDGVLGRFVATLARLAGEPTSGSFLVTVLFGGALGSLYSLLQFLFAPVWGGLSDRIGRRPALLVTLAGTAASYLAWCFSPTFLALLVSRFFGGVMAGNLATVSAVVSDATDPKRRAVGMGVIGAAIGIGFVIGPALGGLAFFLDLTTRWPALTAYGLHRFSAPALVAFALALFNFLFALARFPETLPKERRGLGASHRTANPLRMFSAVHSPEARRVNVILFCFATAFSAMEFSLVFLAKERFDFGPRDNAMLFVFVGLLIAFVQGGALRGLANVMREQQMSTLGLLLVAPGFLFLGGAREVWMLYVGLGLMAVGSALLNPSLGALASRYAPVHEQGLALGVFRSVGALSRAVGPLLGGLLYFRLGSSSPYVAGAIALLVPIALSLRLPDPSPPEAIELPGVPKNS